MTLVCQPGETRIRSAGRQPVKCDVAIAFGFGGNTVHSLERGSAARSEALFVDRACTARAACSPEAGSTGAPQHVPQGVLEIRLAERVAALQEQFELRLKD